jgi:hypothetical protein
MKELSVPPRNMSVHQLYREKYEPWTDFINIEAGRYAAITYFSLALLFALAGNSIIIVATTKYNAVKLDKVTNTLIQHLAVTDIGNAIVGMIPSLITLIADRWTFGSLFCDVLAYLRMIFYYSSVFMVCALNICKLSLLLFPPRARNWSRRSGHFVALIAWSFYILYQVVALVFGKFASVTFEYRIMSCWYVPADFGLGHGFSILIVVGLLGYVPILIVVLTTVALLVLALRVAGRRGHSIQWQGAVTVLSIAGIYCLTYLPFFLYQNIYNNFYSNPAESDMSLKTKAIFYLKLFTITNAIAYLNNFANIFIYYISIASFKTFIDRKLLSALQLQQETENSNTTSSANRGTRPSII